MKKTKVNIILTLLLSILAVSSLWLLPANKNSVNASSLPQGFLVAGTTNIRKAQSFIYGNDTGWQYDYVNIFSNGEEEADELTATTTNPYIAYDVAYGENGVITDFSNQEKPYVVLNNFISEQNLLKESPIKSNVQNFYIGVGKQFNADDITNEVLLISNAQVFLKNDYIYEKYSSNKNYNNNNDYGIYIKSNAIGTGSVNFNNGSITNNYWYNYFDLTSTYAIVGENESNVELVTQAEGLYTVVLTYTYNKLQDNTVSTTNGQFVYQFYLLSNKSYYETPDFNYNVFTYNKNNSGSAYYFNTYQQLDYPTYIYNASKFNVSYTYNYNVIYDNYTSTFALSFNENKETGILSFYKNGLLDHTIQMVLDNTSNTVYYYNNTVANENLYGWLTLSKNENGYTEYKLSLNNVKDYKDIVVKQGPLTPDQNALPIDYYYCIFANQLGEYTFNNKYIVSNGEGTYETIDYAKDLLKNIGVYSVYGNEVLKFSSYNNGTLVLPKDYNYVLSDNSNFDGSEDGILKLYNYGTNAYFYKEDGIKTNFEYLSNATDIRSSITHTINKNAEVKDTEITESNVADIINKLQLNSNALPNTNLQPIYFDYFGQYAYSSETFSSEYYYFDKNQYTVNESGIISINDDQAAIKQVLKPTDGIELDGLFVVKTIINYSDIDLSNLTAIQYYAFIIDNSAPKVTFKYQNFGNDTKFDLDTSTKFTNKDIISAYWQEANYFQGEITAVVDRRAINADERNEVLSSTNYEIGSPIMLGTDEKTLTGHYTLTVYYGKSGGGSREKIFIKDTQLPTANVYGVTDGQRTETASQNYLFNSLFTFAGSNVKNSGAKISAYTIKVPFTQLTNFTAEKLSNSVTTNIVFDANNALFNESNFEPFNLNEEVVVEDDRLLGQDGSMVYIFKLVDEANNVNYFYYIYDESKPYSVFLNENNEVVTFETLDHTSDKQLSAYWGNKKSILINNHNNNNSNLYNNFVTYVSNNYTKYYNVVLTEESGKYYLQLNIDNVVVKSTITTTESTSEVDAITSVDSKELANYFTAYLPSQKDVMPQNLNEYWTLNNSSYLTYQFFIGSKSYYYNVVDALGNESNNYFTINTDKAKLQFDISYDNSKTENNVDYNRAYNANTLSISYNKYVSDSSNALVSYTPKVTYDFYAFSFESYLTDTNVEKSDEVFGTNEYSIYADDNSVVKFTPTYPFSSTPLQKDIYIDVTESADGKSMLSGIINNNGENLTTQGLYVFKRVYLDSNNNELTNEQVKDQISQDDVAVLFRIIYVDRNGVFDITFDSNSDVSTTYSIGDYIKAVLGNQSQDETVLNSGLLYNLVKTYSSGASSTSEIFNTNKVNVNFDLPIDKYATSNKLNNNNNTKFEVGNYSNEIESAVKYNHNMFKHIIDLQLGDQFIIEKQPLADDSDIINVLSTLNKAGSYTLTIYDNSYITQKSENGSQRLYNTANYEVFRFRISHTSPSGQYLSALNDSQSSEIPLTVKQSTTNKVLYVSSNREVLKFKFEETLDIYSAKINPDVISITKNGTEILSKNGNDVSLPNGVVWEDVVSKELIDCNCTCDNCSVENHEQCQNLTQEKVHAYSYTYTIFDNFNNNINYLSTYDEDAIYTATIQFIGNKDSYSVDGTSFYNCTFEIYIDRIKPYKNLEMLKANDKNYSNQNLLEYFLPVSLNVNNLTVFDGSDDYESTALFIKEMNINAFVPSLLPTDEGYYDPSSSSNPRFSELNAEYSKIIYNDNKQIPANIEINGSPVFKNNTYYEVIERDEAGNYTKYYIYTYNGTGENIKFSYYANETDKQIDGTLDENGEILNTIRYAEINSENTLKDTTQFEYDDINNSNTLNILNVYDLVNIDYVGDVNYDAFIDVKIYARPTETLLTTLTCGGSTETLENFFQRVIATFNTVSDQNPTLYEYKLVITNRFNDLDYAVNINLPGEKLQLSFVNTPDGTLKVTLPGKSNTVQLQTFRVERFNSGWQVITNDLYKTIVTTGNPLESTTYEFGPGQYKFITEDNFGRKTETFMFVGTSNDGNYTLEYLGKYITTNEQLIINSSKVVPLVTTGGNVELTIDNSLWDVTVETLNNNAWLEYKGFKESSLTNTSLTKYTFHNQLTYRITLRWATADNTEDNKVYYYFKIDKTLPTLELWSTSGAMEQTDNSSYTENFTIEWYSKYNVTASLVITQNGSTSTINFSNETRSYYVEATGSYVLTVTDEIGNFVVFKFTKTKATYTYFAVKVNDNQIDYSNYTSNIDNRTVYYYYVNYEKIEYGEHNVEFKLPKVSLITNHTKGILSTATQTAVIKDGNNIVNVGEFDQYTIYSIVNDTEYIVCYVRIVYVVKTNDFALVNISSTAYPQGINKNITTTNVYESNESSLTINFKEFNAYENSANTDVYKGNLVYADYYYNGNFVKTISSKNLTFSNKQSFEISLPGLHTFNFYDNSNNKQQFKLNDTQLTNSLDIFLINGIVYYVNNDIPINNAFYNDAVTLQVVTNLGGKELFNEKPLVAATLNGQDLEVVDDKTENVYTFTESGYYTVTILGKVTVNGDSFELSTTYKFTIINEEIAKISFSMSSSYGFTITKLLRNDGDVTSTLTTLDSLWLSAGEFNADNALYTVYCSYYNQAYNQFQNFSFKVWINDSTPVIVPVNYTYGTSTKKVITLQFDGLAIYNEIGQGYISIKNLDDQTEERIQINSSSISGVQEIKISKEGTYSIGIYNDENRLISSYKVIKKQPLNTSYIIIIVVSSVVVVALAAVFIFIRKRAKFR